MKTRWGRRTLGKANFSLAKLISQSALSTGQSLEAVSEQVYLVTPITFRRTLFPSTVCGRNLRRLGGWAEVGFWEYSSQALKILKEKGRRLHRGLSGERGDNQSPWCSVICWGTASVGCSWPFQMQMYFPEVS